MDKFLDKLSDAPEDDFPVNIHDGKFLSGRLSRLREIEASRICITMLPSNSLEVGDVMSTGGYEAIIFSEPET